jgi:XTP/dITP diphosphohydrolase
MAIKNPPSQKGVAGLIELMNILRAADGCAWDLEQTHESLIQYLIEESFEFAEAVEKQDRSAIKEELGDVLLQVVFHSQIAQEDEKDPFNIDEVADVITQKLIKRHPHIFESDVEISADQVKDNWEQIKQKEKNRTSPAQGLPIALPALIYADKLITRVKSISEFKNPVEIDERIKSSINDEDKAGDFLLAFVAMCNEKGIDPEKSLRKTIRKYKEELEN